MHLIIYTVGRVRGPGWKDLSDDYLARIRHYVRCDINELKDDNELVRKWPKSDVTIALEVNGNKLSSVQFARHLERWSHHGKGQVSLVIGGAEGIPSELSRRADYLLSLSSMTLPHRLAKVVLLEQVYRALTIIRGEPYARES